MALTSGATVPKRFAALDPQWPVRGRRAPRGLQILDLQDVRAAAGITHYNDEEYHAKTKAVD
jgi:hypothetical protein